MLTTQSGPKKEEVSMRVHIFCCNSVRQFEKLNTIKSADRVTWCHQQSCIQQKFNKTSL